MDNENTLPKLMLEENMVYIPSAAYITWMLHRDDEAKTLRDKHIAELEESDDERKDREIIKRLSKVEDFFKWMRKPLKGKNKFLLRDIMLNREAEIIPMVKEKIMTNWIDDFVECAIELFIECNEDPSQWIRDNYFDVRNPYARSELCLVLGFRGGKEDTAFLLEETKRFVMEYPDEDFEQGPVIALYMIHGYEDYIRNATHDAV